MASGGSRNGNSQRMYVHQLPYSVMRKLCGILDIDNKWEELGGEYLRFTYPELQRFHRAVYQGESPADQMLRQYGQKNGVADHLFIHLSKMRHYQAMEVLLPYVSDKVKHLYETGEGHTFTMIKGSFPAHSGWPLDPPKYSQKLSSSSQLNHSLQYINTSQGYTSSKSHHYPSHKEPVEGYVPSEYNMNSDIRNSQNSNYHNTKYIGSRTNFNDEYPDENMKSKEIPLFPCENKENADYPKYKKSVRESSKCQFLKSKEIAEHLTSCTDEKMNGVGKTEINEVKLNNVERVYKSNNISGKSVNESLKNINLPGKVSPDNSDHNIGLKVSKTRKEGDGNNISVTPSRKSSKEENLPVSSPRKISKEENLPVSSPRKISSEDNGYLTPYRKNSNEENSMKSPSMKGNLHLKPAQRENNYLGDSKRKTSIKESISPSSVLQIPYYEILTATDQFTSTILGQGGFGTVYQGKWKNMSVAIKRIRRNRQETGKMKGEDPKLQQSFTELRTLDSCRHDNILPLYGFCLNDEGLCLVYQFMSNGSLEDRLQCRNNAEPLDWIQRCNILRGAACGIEYLHSLPDRPLIHGDIKCANILLDKTLEPKIGDFGLVCEGPDPDQSTKHVLRVQGTLPYLPPEYLKNHRLSTKVDSYSMGVVLFEVATGTKAYDENRSRSGLPKMLVEVVAKHHDKNHLERICDRKAGTECSELFYFLISLGQICTENLKNKRPEMKQIIQQFDTQLQHIRKPRKKSNPSPGVPIVAEAKAFPASPIQGYFRPEHQMQAINEPAKHQSKVNGIRETPRPKSPVEQTTPLMSSQIKDMYDKKSTIEISSKELETYDGDSFPPSYKEVMESSTDYKPENEELDHGRSPGSSSSNLKNESPQLRDEEPSDLLPNLSIFHNDGQDDSSALNEVNETNPPEESMNRVPTSVNPSAKTSCQLNAANGMVQGKETLDVLVAPSLTAKGKSLTDFGIFNS